MTFDRFLEMIRFETWGAEVFMFGGRALTALLMLLIGWWIAARIGNLVKRAILARGGDRVLAAFLRRVVVVVMMVLILVAALDRLGVPITSLLAALGAAGLAVGLAMRDSLANVASGVLLVISRPFKANDHVDIGGQVGKVDRIDLLQTILVTFDNRIITVPNAQVMNTPIINFSARSERRLDLPISIAYEDDPIKAIAVVRKVLDEHPRVLKTREPLILISSLAASSVDLSVRPWVRTDEVIGAQSELLAAIKSALEHEGITIPFPQQVMRMVGAPTPMALPPAAPAPASEPEPEPEPGKRR